MSTQHRIRRRTGKIVRCRRATERPDLGVTLANKIRLYYRHDQAEVEAVRHAVREVHRRDLNVEIHGQMKIHRVVFENGHAIKRAVGAEQRVATLEVHVLMRESETDIVHVDAAQGCKAKSGAANPRQHSSAAERLRPLGEDRACRCGRADRDTSLEPKGLATARRADRHVGYTGAKRIGDERDQRRVLGVRRWNEMEAVCLQRGGIVGVARTGEEKRSLSGAENKKLRDSVAESLRT